jgi:hypothetical protein
MKKKVKIIMCIILLFVVSLFIYVFSFDDIEPICNKTKYEEYYLVNFFSKKGLREKTIKHNEYVKFNGSEFQRIYLENNIFRFNDPIWDDVIDYKKEKDCNNVDSRDLYCVIRFWKMENGKTRIFYNFVAERKSFTIIK